jgi:hypothetical protein
MPGPYVFMAAARIHLIVPAALRRMVNNSNRRLRKYTVP